MTTRTITVEALDATVRSHYRQKHHPGHAGSCIAAIFAALPAEPAGAGLRSACEDARCDQRRGHLGQHTAFRDAPLQALREALDGAIGTVRVYGQIDARPASHYAAHVEVRLRERGYALAATPVGEEG